VSAPDIAAIRARVADGIFLGGDYHAAYEQFLIAHRDRTALLAELDELTRDHDTLVERSVGAMAIAEGDEGYEKVPIDCPMLAAVGNLRQRVVALESAVKIVHQALIEVHHAQSVGASWYTKGHAGLYNQVAMWVRKGLDAIAAVRLKEDA
jgi:hypothetical protein